MSDIIINIEGFEEALLRMCKDIGEQLSKLPDKYNNIDNTPTVDREVEPTIEFRRVKILDCEYTLKSLNGYQCLFSEPPSSYTETYSLPVRKVRNVYYYSLHSIEFGRRYINQYNDVYECVAYLADKVLLKLVERGRLV